MLQERDIVQMSGKGISPAQAEKQIEYFRSGFPYLPIDKAAVAGDGIVRLDLEQTEKYIELYDSYKKGLLVVKFVPASGAASRMFKDMYEFVNEGKKNESVARALEKLEKFAFYDKLKNGLPEQADEKTIVENIVEGTLGYGKAPKALILFHRYTDGSRTALEEHLAEGAMYAASKDGAVHIHFTISPEHEDGFRKLVDEMLSRYEKKHGVKYSISYSQQKPHTDTIAVDLDNEPFREQDGSILFRPGGHGALIENLNDINADLVFIKTIDNVCPDKLKSDTVTYKKALGGLLLKLQSKCFGYLKSMDAGMDEKGLKDAAEFARKELQWQSGSDFDAKTLDEKIKTLQEVLHRPIRVCGMVKNEGEPGGGPFWVRNEDGSLSLQIAESSQIAPEQKILMQKATHFNPVDLVCGVRDYKGKKFDLMRYVDPQTGFISTKSKDGRELKAQELPGLWNGAMANWNTVFVEVPITTFSPVKTVNDLLRPQHQA